ncbi:putative acetyltransferase [Rhodobacteraceae bacterium KLH11]|nr:putative acetyltransferase [Rhodobacteraceae bacterium KLH11]
MEKADLGVIAHWFQDVHDLALFDRTTRIPMNLTQIEQSWSDVIGGAGNDHTRCWFIIENSDSDAVGMIGLEAISTVNRDAVVPVFVDKSIRRHGVAVRAVALMLDFAFRQLGLNRITSYYRADNHSSRDLISRVGCKIEGTMRQAWFAEGQYHDMVVVGMLQQDWAERRQALARELGPETVVRFDSSNWSWPPQHDANG